MSIFRSTGVREARFANNFYVGNSLLWILVVVSFVLTLRNTIIIEQHGTQGVQGETGPMGPTGPTGPAGTTVGPSIAISLGTCSDSSCSDPHACEHFIDETTCHAHMDPDSCCVWTPHI